MNQEQPVQEKSTPPSGRTKARRAPPRTLGLFLPFVLSGTLFSSVFFAVFSPLPLLVTRFKGLNRWFYPALLSNGLVVGVIMGVPLAVAYLILVGTVCSVYPYLLGSKRASLEKTAVIAFLTIAALGAGAFLTYTHLQRIDPVVELKHWVKPAVEQFKNLQGLSDELGLTPEEIELSLMRELPSGIAILLLVFVWANLVFVIRMQPKVLRGNSAISRKILSEWKAPDWLVWPLIAAGYAAFLMHGPISVIAMNVMKFLLAIFAIQGLSILSFVFNHLKIYGILRSLISLFIVFWLLFLVIGVGFFDLWLDVRGKLRQSLKP